VVFEPLLKGVSVFGNLVENTGWDGLQVGSAIENCNIHHNRVIRDSQANEPNQRSGIGSGNGSSCNIYNNFIKESGSKAIRSEVYGNVKIYNNVIVSPGQKDLAQGFGIIILNQGVSGKSVHVLNNTIIYPSASGINFSFSQNSASLIQNNLIVKVDDKLPIQTSYRNVTVSSNLTSNNIADIRFTDPTRDNYSLQSNSPAVDTGINLSNQGITSDYTGTPRPQGQNFDKGAYESPRG
jgi:hypothetical protein